MTGVQTCALPILILLADEPTGNLDPATSVGIMRILDRISRTGTTVVMATHDHAIVDAMQRRVVELDRGRIARDESRGIYETRIQDSPVPSEIDGDVPADEAEDELEEIVDRATEETLADAIAEDRTLDEESQPSTDEGDEGDESEAEA